MNEPSSNPANSLNKKRLYYREMMLITRDTIRRSSAVSWTLWFLLLPGAALVFPQSKTLPNASSTKGRRVNLGKGVVLEFVTIPAGSFPMGSPNGYDNERPVHRVHMTHGFELGKFEVTQGQWQTVMGGNPSYFNYCGKDCPVEFVSWNNVQQFLAKMNDRKDGYWYRLPTEAEWEYAARAGTTGDYAGNLDAMGWHGENSAGRTHPVGEKQANPWGLHDMHGNVWEWVNDWYEGNYYARSTLKVPQGPSSGRIRVNRGGSWYGDRRSCRSANRGRCSPDSRSCLLGFRLARVSILAKGTSYPPE